MIFFMLGCKNSNFLNKLAKIFIKLKNKKKILIVPDQFLFFAEKQMAKLFKFTKIEVEVLTFSQLNQKILQQFSNNKPFAQKIHKIGILTLTLIHLQNNLNYFSFLIQKFDFIEIMLEEIENLINCQLNFKQLLQKIKKINNYNLKFKFIEFLTIAKTYKKNLTLNFNYTINAFNDKNKIYDVFLKNTEIFFMEFLTFTNFQFNLIEQLMKTNNLHFIFYGNGKTKNNFFNITITTKNKILKMCKKNQIKNACFLVKSKIKKSPILNLIDGLFINNNLKIKNSNLTKLNLNNFKIFSANNIFEEINWVIIKIIELIKQKHNFNDILILLTNFNFYKSILISALKKHNLPFFLDEQISIKSMNLIKLCTYLIETAHSNSNLVSNFLLILKTNLTKFSKIDVCLFENYVQIWQLNSKTFQNKFKNNPRGFVQNNEFQKTDWHILQKIKTIQNTLIRAINFLKLSENSVKSIASNLIISLKILGICDKNLCNKLVNSTQKNKFKLEWNSLILLLENLFKIIKNKPVTLKQFEILFKTTANNLKIKQIQPTLNCVFIGNVNVTIPPNKKFCFILGANESTLPTNKQNYFKCFSNFELNFLNKLQIKFSKTTIHQNNLNKLFTYRSICCSTQKLFISFLNKPCEFINLLQQKFNLKPLTKINNLTKCLTKKLAFDQFLFNYDNKSIESKTLEFLILQNNDFDNNFLKNTPETFTKNSQNHVLTKSLNNNFTLNLTTSQIEKFFICPFAYFCEFILKIKPPPSVYSFKQNIGFIYNDILTNIVSTSNFLNLNFNQLKFILQKNINTRLNHKNNLPKNFKTMSKINLNKLLILCQNIQKELKNSNFQPIKFNNILKNSLKLSNNSTVLINNKIDRIDFKKEFNVFRIVNYKIHSSPFTYSELINGLNLRLILNAMAVMKNENFNKKIDALALLNVKILGNLTSYYSINNKTSTQQIDKNMNNGFFQNGLILYNSLNSFKNNEHFNLLELLPFSKTSTQNFKKADLNNKIINKIETEILFKFVENKIMYIYNKIKNYSFPKTKHCSDPSSNFEQTNCSICKYCEICNPNLIINIKQHKNLNKLTFFNLIDEEFNKKI